MQCYNENHAECTINTAFTSCLLFLQLPISHRVTKMACVQRGYINQISAHITHHTEIPSQWYSCSNGQV